MQGFALPRWQRKIGRVSPNPAGNAQSHPTPPEIHNVLLCQSCSVPRVSSLLPTVRLAGIYLSSAAKCPGKAVPQGLGQDEGLRVEGWGWALMVENCQQHWRIVSFNGEGKPTVVWWWLAGSEVCALKGQHLNIPC